MTLESSYEFKAGPTFLGDSFRASFMRASILLERMVRRDNATLWSPGGHVVLQGSVLWVLYNLVMAKVRGLNRPLTDPELRKLISKAVPAWYFPDKL